MRCNTSSSLTGFNAVVVQSCPTPDSSRISATSTGDETSKERTSNNHRQRLLTALRLSVYVLVQTVRKLFAGSSETIIIGVVRI